MPVFDDNNSCPNSTVPTVLESSVTALWTSHTKGDINSVAFLQCTPSPSNLSGAANSLAAGHEQLLLSAGNKCYDIQGSLITYLKGTPPLVTENEGTPVVAPLSGVGPVGLGPPTWSTGVAPGNAYVSTTGKDFQSLVLGRRPDGTYQTGTKQVKWDTEVTTNDKEVKVSYFVENIVIHTANTTILSFGPETLIQWGNRTVLRYSTETRVNVGGTNLIQEGSEVVITDGVTMDRSADGTNMELVDGGTDFNAVLGAKAMLFEGAYFLLTPLGVAYTQHLVFAGIQLIGMASAALDWSSAQFKSRKFTASVQAFLARASNGGVNVRWGAVFGTPRF